MPVTGPIDLTDLNQPDSPIAGICIFGSGANAESFYRISSWGTHIVIGSPGDDRGGSFAGAIFHFPGIMDPGTGAINLGQHDAADRQFTQIIGPQPTTYLGLQVGVGDFDGDGLADVFAPLNNIGIVIHGVPDEGPRDLSLNTSDFNTTTIRTDFPIQTMTSIADVDGDGLGDLAIGMLSAAYGNGYSGAVRIVRGSPTPPDEIDIANDPGDSILIIGENGADGFGATIVGNFDFNGDGFDDLAIGAPGFNADGGAAANGGAVYVILGDESGLPSGPIDMKDAPAGRVIRIESPYSNDLLGSSLDAGDMDGDGIADLIIGAYGSENDRGSVFVVYGGQSFGEVLSLDSFGPTEFAQFGNLGDDNYFGYSLKFVGDGFGDFIAGAPGNDTNGTDAGAAVLVFGGPRTGPVDLSNSDSDQFIVLLGHAAGDAAGTTVFGGGDFNGDGLTDFGVGAPFSDAYANRAGKGYLIYGSEEFGPNFPPNAIADEAITDEDTSVAIAVLANDSDPEGDAITLVSATVTDGEGTVTLSGDNLIYDPGTGYDDLGLDQTASVQIEYTISALGGTATGTVFLTVTGVNDPPVAVDDEAVTDEDTEILISVLTNDTDVDGGPLVISAAGLVGTGQGDVVIEGDQLRYIPSPAFEHLQAGDFEVIQVFYQVSDGAGGADTGTVFVTINGVNDDPVANADSAATAHDTAVVIPVLANDTDVDGGPLQLVAAFPPTSGTVVANGDGTVTFTPEDGFSGTATFEYRVGDGNGGFADAAVTVLVAPPNSPPVAVNDTFSTDEDDAVTIAIADLLDNDFDPDGDEISFVDFTYVDLGPDLDGSITRVGNNLIYTPDPDFNGSDTFTYTISDGQFTDTAVVTITVEPVNDPPVAADDALITAEDTSVDVTFDVLLGNDTDADGDVLTITNVGGAGNGTVSVAADVITYTPRANYNGPDSFTYTVSDGNGGTDVGIVNVTVTPVNDPPFIIPPVLALFTLVDTPVSYVVQAGDVDGDALTITANGAASGTLSNGPAFAGLVYTPDAGYAGGDGFTVVVTDVVGATASQAVTVTVGDLPDPDEWRLFASSGFTGGIGGNGQVFGTSGFQDITILDQPGFVLLDPSFNQGGDIARLSGDARDWFVIRRGSTALLSDGDTFVLRTGSNKSLRSMRPEPRPSAAIRTRRPGSSCQGAGPSRPRGEWMSSARAMARRSA